MGLFKIFAKEKENKLFFDDLKIDTSDWNSVFSACLGKMITIQSACSELVVKCRNWNVDFSQGVISFGEDKYPLQFIGSESASSNTWLWGWENVNGFSEKIISTAKKAKDIGENWQLEPLIAPEFELDNTFNGHNLAIVVCGINQDYCYYRGPHSGGAIFVAFSGMPKEVFEPINSLKFTTIAMECIQQYNVDHKIFIESFLLWNKTKYKWDKDIITAYFDKELYIKFEQVNNTYRINSVSN